MTSRIRSMTAFARLEEQSEAFQLTWEIKSVNHRYLEIGMRLPEKLRHLEQEIRNRLRKNLGRGKIDLGLRVEEHHVAEAALQVDEALVKQLVEAKDKIESLLVASNTVNAIDIMRWPGVLSSPSSDTEKLEELALASFDKALALFIENREREGAELEQMVSQRLEKIADFVALFRKTMPETLANHREKLQTRLMQILD